MKKTITIIAAMLLISISAMAQQPDLTLTSETVIETTAQRGETINIYMDIQNIGNATSGNCHVGIYLSQTTSFTGATLLSVISLESLAAGASDIGIEFNFPVPYNVTDGTYYVLYALDILGEVNESNENNNNFHSISTINISSYAAVQNLPYPIIFVHGLNSDYLSCWDSLMLTLENYYGWVLGGNMDFCLNYDNDVTTANVLTNYHDFNSNIWKGDLYTVNFDVNPNGVELNNTVESNQSAVAKQGYAIRDAIAHVLQVTGRDKVILVGHSMGGLASREYLQNSNIWQPDGQHHVAKLFTVGTPHGGSNQTAAILAPFFPIDEYSEAVRDLRWSYYTGYPGAYLFGDTENTTEIAAALGFYFYNVDVNCNGVINDNIVGLNNTAIPNNLYYSCAIGTGSNLGGDGVVDPIRANLNTYYPSIADTFILQEVGVYLTSIWHQHLTQQIAQMVQGLDEANDYQFAYDISFDTLYYGIISKQSLGGPYTIDYDDYKFNVPSTGNLLMQVFNIQISQYNIYVLNSSYSSVFTQNSDGKSYVAALTNLSAGQYYFELSGTPTASSWEFPYAFQLYFSSTVGIEETSTY